MAGYGIDWGDNDPTKKKAEVQKVGPVSKEIVDVSGPAGSGNDVARYNVGYEAEEARKGRSQTASTPAQAPTAPAAPSYQKYELPRQEFANIEGVPQQILDLRQRALGGLSQGEQNAMRGSAVSNIQGTTSNLQNTLARNQARSGVRGGIAFAQGDAIRRQALQARAGSEREILLRDADIKRQALNDLQGYVGKERYGSGAENLAEAQINMQGQAGFDQRQILNRMLEQEQDGGGAGFINKEKGGGLSQDFKNFAGNTLNPINSIRDFARVAPGHTKDLFNPDISLATKARRPIDFLMGRR